MYTFEKKIYIILNIQIHYNCEFLLVLIHILLCSKNWYKKCYLREY